MSADERGIKRRMRDDESSDEEQDADNVQELEEEELVDVDFDFCDPDESSWHSVKRSLAKYMDLKEWNAGDLADVITNQHGIGTVVKVEEQPVAFLTALDMHLNAECMGQIKQYLLGKCRDPARRGALESLFVDDSTPLGLLINYRLNNVPSQIAPALHRALFDEIAEVSREEPEFGFVNYVILTQYYNEKNEGSLSDRERSGKRARADVVEDHYFILEDECYREEASLEFTFPLIANEDDKITLDRRIRPSGLAMVVPADNIHSILNKLEILCTSGLAPEEIGQIQTEW